MSGMHRSALFLLTEEKVDQDFGRDSGPSLVNGRVAFLVAHCIFDGISVSVKLLSLFGQLFSETSKLSQSYFKIVNCGAFCRPS